MDPLVDRFPFPFGEKAPHRYSNNSVPLDPPLSVEVTPTYREEVELKRRLLREVHSRCYRSLPGTEEAQWEAAQLVLDHLAGHAPERFRLKQEEDRRIFVNRVMEERREFTFRDASTLPCEPLDFAGRHVQEDLILMAQKDGELILEAGQLCFPANWSLAFKLGMTFREIHEPIPGFNEGGLSDQIERFLLRMEAGRPWVRRNWSLTVGRHLDTSPETIHRWGRQKKEVTPENAGSLVHLRVEVQKLFRLPRSHAVLFTIHTHLLPLEKLARRLEWLERFHRVVTTLSDEILKYKGILEFHEPMVRYLEGLRAGGGRKA
ncbi:uncharacterized protein DUF3445 [Melghirimyces profundicolus]|uniref:Uncharacterized protein DUF3445 n=1 Tax=Melghirimyces profundicolus TaxID=1242148 RepID=A0A2T6C8E6_9BACL|nr:DUF3445 domain-containing protein [Melghirimyces profundicolus]PTX64582.1 uncharacterized protein DUF3445 [Melghirimyces profundicolus]